jgi:hypothetical protein
LCPPIWTYRYHCYKNDSKKNKLQRMTVCVLQMMDMLWDNEFWNNFGLWKHIVFFFWKSYSPFIWLILSCLICQMELENCIMIQTDLAIMGSYIYVVLTSRISSTCSYHPFLRQMPHTWYFMLVCNHLGYKSTL